MKPLLYVIATGLLVAAGLGLRSNQQLQREKAENEAVQVEAKRLTKENAEIDLLEKENEAVQRLREETRDLHKLRNEVQQLRHQVKDIEGLRQENEALRAQHAAATNQAASPPAKTLKQTLRFDQLAYAGLATPEAALQSAFWAMREGNSAVLAQCISSDAPDRGRLKTPEATQQMANEMKRNFKSLQIVARRQNTQDEVVLGVQFENSDLSEAPPGAITLKREGNEWKLATAP